jgi:hypothetical protein
MEFKFFQSSMYICISEISFGTGGDLDPRNNFKTIFAKKLFLTIGDYWP